MADTKGGFGAIMGDPGATNAKYIKQKKIGAGSHGDAFLVVDSSEKPPEGKKPKRYVAKVMELPQMTQRDLRYAYSEIRCMSLLNHANIVKYVGDYQSDDALLIVMEYADGGDLERQVKARAARDCEYFKEHEVLFIFLQLCLALDHVHGRKMLHRDLKTANIFLTSAGVVKLGDFGYSHEYAETVSNVVAGTFCGTPVYLAPELWNSKRYSKKADIWSLGVILYEMLALKRPYFSPHMKELMEKILKEDFAPPPPHYSDAMSDLVHFILRKDPSQRPTIRQIFQVSYVQKGLSQLTDIVGRNTLIGEEVKRCLKDHVGEVIQDASAQNQGAPSKMEGNIQLAQATGAKGVAWSAAYLQLDDQKLRVFNAKGDKDPSAEYDAMDITNACPISPTECEVQHVFAIFLTHKPHTVWFRCENSQEANQWLDRILGVSGI